MKPEGGIILFQVLFEFGKALISASHTKPDFLVKQGDQPQVKVDDIGQNVICAQQVEFFPTKIQSLCEYIGFRL